MGTRYPGSPKEVRALNAFIALSRAAESLHARLNRSLEEAGLSVGQFGTLEALYHLGPLCQRDVSRKLLRTGGNVVMIADNLEKRGLLRRVRGEKDRRQIRLHLTEKGRAKVRSVFPPHLARIVALMEALSSSEQEELRRLCRTLGLQQDRTKEAHP
ncbi:MAG TPA: MarR family transcriptional regulator [Elusimicrobia bacterium]|nr:MarR family transcriptional regulator [Elusimicrobiota bacterium]